MKSNKPGFTLVEILIALFIFTILSFLLVSALRTVINADTGAEKKAERLRKLQMALIIMSRDIEQVVDRPIVNTDGKDEASFVGTPAEFRLTHTGYANTPNAAAHGSLQRSAYSFNENNLYRITWPMTDAAPKTKSQTRILLKDVHEVHFQYLNQKGRFVDQWPEKEEKSEALPRAVKIYLTIPKWGKLTQLYLITAEKIETTANAAAMQQNQPDRTEMSRRQQRERRERFYERNMRERMR